MFYVRLNVSWLWKQCIAGVVVDMDRRRSNDTSWRDMAVQSAASCPSQDPLTRLISLADTMQLHLKYEQVPEKRACSRPPYDNQTARRFSSDIVCLETLRFALGQAVRKEEPASFLDSLAASPQGTQKCLLELKALDRSLVFTDPSPEMLKRLHTTIQSLIANNQVSRYLERIEYCEVSCGTKGQYGCGSFPGHRTRIMQDGSTTTPYHAEFQGGEPEISDLCYLHSCLGYHPPSR